MASDAGATAPRAEGAIETDFERQPVGVAPTGDSLPDVATGGGGRSPALPLDEKSSQGEGRAVDSRELRGLRDAYDRLMERRAQLSEDVRDFWTWAKARGFDTDGLREYFARRRNRDRWQSKAAFADLYEDSLDRDVGPMFDVEVGTKSEVGRLRDVLMAGGVHTVSMANLLDAKKIARRHGFSPDAIETVLGDGAPKVIDPLLHSAAAHVERKSEQRERSADEARVDVTTPKGRKASLKASDPIAYQTLSIEGHSAFCDCADCRELRRDTLATNSGANAAPANGKAGTDSARQPLARSGDGESPTAKKPASKAAPKKTAKKTSA